MEEELLDEARVATDPFVQFENWLEAAVAAHALEPYAMTLATSDAAGAPSARVVLLRGYDGRGLTFFTNYESRKGRELTVRPQAAAVFFWPALHRQVRIEGSIERVSAGESDAYFAGRPRGHQLSAWASPQSAELGSRHVLEERLHDAEMRFAGKEIARPANWGGYRLVPNTFEFWQGRINRAHDRIVYTRVAQGWRRARLAP